MRLRLNKAALAFIIGFHGTSVFGLEFDDKQHGFLAALEACLALVKDPSLAFENNALNKRSKTVSVSLSVTVELDTETRDAVTVTTCEPTNRFYFETEKLPERLRTGIRGLSENADLLKINRNSEGEFFGDCQNVPNARYGLAVTPIDAGWTFLAVDSPAVGAPCAHSYGKH